jgi:hypothetical protein
VLNHDAWSVAGKGPGRTWTVDNPNAAASDHFGLVVDLEVGKND